MPLTNATLERLAHAAMLPPPVICRHMPLRYMPCVIITIRLRLTPCRHSYARHYPYAII